jgi:predicted Zn-dependent protease
MRNPQRNDVYVNSEGFKVVVNNVLSPNPAGVQTLEYKFIGSPELCFVPVQEFVEQFEFVETFSSFDINIEERNKLLQIKEEEEAKAALLRKQAKEEAATAIKR